MAEGLDVCIFDQKFEKPMCLRGSFFDMQIFQNLKLLFLNKHTLADIKYILYSNLEQKTNFFKWTH